MLFLQHYGKNHENSFFPPVWGLTWLRAVGSSSLRWFSYLVYEDLRAEGWVWAYQARMGDSDCQRSEFACSICVQGSISVTQNALSVRMSRRSKCVTLVWTAETRHVLMFPQPPTPICLQPWGRSSKQRGGHFQEQCFPVPAYELEKLAKSQL